MKDCKNTKHQIWLMRTTSHCGEENLGELSKSWDGLTSALSRAGLEMNPSKSMSWRPHDPDSEVKVDTGLIVLGRLAVDGSEMPIGVPKLDETNLASDPTTVGADKACKWPKESPT